MLQLLSRLLVTSLVVAMFAQPQTSTISTMVTGPVGSSVAGLAVDRAGNRYLSLFVQGVRTVAGKLIFASTGDTSRGMLVQKITRDGVVEYSSWLRGIADTGPTKMAVNEAGEVFLAGVTPMPLVPTPGALAQQVSPAGAGGFVLKISADGERVTTVAVLTLGANGASVKRIRLDSAGNIFVGIANAILETTPGTYSSAPGGRFSSPGGNYILKLDPAASNILLVVQATEQGDTLADLALDIKGNLYIAGTTRSFLPELPYLRDIVSRDWGETWTVVGDHPRSEVGDRTGTITIHPTDPNVVFQLGDGRLFRSTDAGAHWSKTGAGLESQLIRSLFVSPARPEMMFVLVVPVDGGPSVFRSEDGGNTFESASSEAIVTRVAFDPSDPNLVFLDALSQGTIIRSLDGGRTFERVAARILRNREGTWNLSISPSTGVMYGFSRFGFARSNDRGSNWTLVTPGCTMCSGFPVFIDPDNDSTLHTSASTGLINTTDGGSNWTLASSQGGFDTRSVRWSPSRPRVFFANIGGVVKRTNDAGTTWSPVLVDRSVPWSFEVAQAGAAVIYAAYRRGPDLFVRKFDPAGRELLFSAQAGGFGEETIATMEVNEQGRMLIAGSTVSADFPADSPVASGSTLDAFTVAFDAELGPRPVYARRVGGLGRTYAADLAVGCNGGTILAVMTTSNQLASSGAAQTEVAGGQDVLVLQLDDAGGTTDATYFGGDGDDIAFAVAADVFGRIYLAGSTGSSSLPGLANLETGKPVFTSTINGVVGACR